MHSSLKGYRLLFDRTEQLRKKLPINEMTKNVIPGTDQGISKLKELADKKPYQMMDLTKMSYKEIRNIMLRFDSNLNIYEDYYIRVKKAIDEEFIDQMTPIVDRVFSTNIRGLFSVGQVERSMDILIGTGTTYFEYLLVISMISSPHEDFTRYPDDHGNGLSWEDYTKDLGIVKALPELRMRLKEAIDFIHCRMSTKGRIDTISSLEGIFKDTIQEK